MLVRDGIPLSAIKMIMEKTGSSLRLKPVLIVRIVAVLSKTEVHVNNFFEQCKLNMYYANTKGKNISI